MAKIATACLFIPKNYGFVCDMFWVKIYVVGVASTNAQFHCNYMYVMYMYILAKSRRFFYPIFAKFVFKINCVLRYVVNKISPLISKACISILWVHVLINEIMYIYSN